MTQDKFTVVGGQLSGRGLVLDVSTLLEGKDPEERLQARLVEIGETIYAQGRDSLQLSFDASSDLRDAIETLRGLAVVVGVFGGDRHRRAADTLEQLLHEHRRIP